ncbi:MAG: sulfurtransferase [Steroidobacteraceae bacterium]|jgi:thiosulfate/3-mercaptopyruvate sulfurtransferase|nr:sulfurtransferase [Steroidobacteraceae bacterium]
MERLTTLVDVAGLAARLHDPDLVVLDCRFDLARPAWGREAWAAGHVPGAQHADLDRDLAAPVGPSTGRHPLPSPGDFAARAGAWGIDERVQVVAYDQGNGMYAARAWWLFRWLGHRAVAVLDGGFAAWTAAGQPVDVAEGARAPRSFVDCRDRGATVDAGFVAANLGNAAGMRLVDARGADRFAGQNETLDPVAGHVPGAVNHPFTRNVDASGRMRPAAELRAEWLRTLGGVPPTTLVAMCGSGVSACHNLLALEHAGLGGARLYPGSWSEWIRDPSRPVATGPAS